MPGQRRPRAPPHYPGEPLTQRARDGHTRAVGWQALALLALAGAAAVLALAGAAAAAPSVNITNPTPSQIIGSGTVTIDLTVSEFVLDYGAAGSAPVSGQGHYHLYLDGALAKEGGTPSTFLAGVEPGAHVLLVELVGNDHAAIGANNSVNFSVAAGSPSLRLVSPADGALVPLNWTTFAVVVTNFTLDPAAVGGTAVAGHGHYHIFLDGQYKGLAATPTAFIADLPAGNHTLRVALHQNDHQPVTPAVFDEVALRIDGKHASISILQPADGVVVWGTQLSLRVVVTNFTLDPAAVGSAPAPGRGHWHALIDGVYAGFSTNDSISLNSLTPGDHTVTVALYNNDHTALAVPAQASITVHAAALPSVRLTAPANNSEVVGASVTLSINTTNITLDRSAIGNPSVAGHGHYHVSVDGVYIDAGADTTYVLGNLTAGAHVITVSLHNNDHTAIPGAAPAEVHITVKAAASGGFLPGFDAWITLSACAGAASAACLLDARRRRGLC